MKSTLTVEPAEAGLRLDRLLMRHLAGMNRMKVRSLLDTGRVLLNGEPVAGPGALVRAGDSIVISAGGDLLADPPPHLMHEDRAFTVAFKPAGAAIPRRLLLPRRSHGPAGSVVAVRTVLPLDRRASGVVLAALYPRTLRQLTGQFEAGKATRRYLALVDRVLTRVAGSLSPEAPGWSYRLRKRFHSATLIQLVPPPDLDADPLAALASAGLWPRSLPGPGPARLALHLGSVTLQHPSLGRTLSFDPPLPPSLRRCLDALEPAAVVAAPPGPRTPAGVVRPELALRSPRDILRRRR